MLQAAEIKATDKVLVVGAASGYAAALVAKMAAQVTATESDPALAAKAAASWPARLWKCHGQDRGAADGDTAGAPYDVIVLNGATEIVPERLYEQLGQGGRLVGRFC